VNDTPPRFLPVELVLAIHEEMIHAYGGSHGIREPGLVESAVAQGQNAYYYGKADFFEIAAAYAYHLAESQAFLDGNKRAGAATALTFLEMNGVDITRISTREVYEMMIQIATKEMTKSGLADMLRSRLG
jgi:death on curing protein